MIEIGLGIDVGSTTVKLVVVSGEGEVLAHRYVRSNGQPRETLLATSRLLDEQFPGARVVAAGLTGSGGGAVADLVGGIHANELVTQTRAVGLFHPEARTVIEIGGQDSKFLSVEWDATSGQMVLVDFAMNALCAAGTGSFLDQQAERLGIRIDGEFAALALASRSPARIAGRCTVFAKSDMIHLQQVGCPLPDILAGLCQALARNFRSVIGKGKRFTPPVLFQGGVARNAAVGRAFEDVLGLRPGELVVPRHSDVMAAIGAAHVALDELREGREHPFHGFAALEAALHAGGDGDRSLPALAPHPHRATCVYSFPAAGGRPAPVHLGVDVGSISTNVVLVDEQDRVVARRYLPTAGKPLDAVREALAQIGQEIGGRVEVRGAGATGSGRHLVGQFVGADTVRNEITAQARAAVAIDPDVDTVIEIGGQDSKFIRIDRGVVVDFAMNSACAAGTGSFLEEQAERLGISIRDEFAALAHRAPAPSCLGERCTVFMESDLVHHQQRGASVPDLAAGLAYSIVHNYLNRVVDARAVGTRILFLGGVAHNSAVASAFEAVLGRPVRVPPHHDVTGAIGAALLAREEMEAHPGRGTRFRGFESAQRRYEMRSVVCRACPNLCDVKQVVVDDEPPTYYGARCDRFESAAAHGASASGGEDPVPDLFAARTRLLLGDHEDPGPRGPRPRPGRPPARPGLPRPLPLLARLLPAPRHGRGPLRRHQPPHRPRDRPVRRRRDVLPREARLRPRDGPAGEGRGLRLPAERRRPRGPLAGSAAQPPLPPRRRLAPHGEGPRGRRGPRGPARDVPVPPAGAGAAPAGAARGGGRPRGAAAPGALRRGVRRRGASRVLPRGRAAGPGRARRARSRPGRGRDRGASLQHVRRGGLPRPAPHAAQARGAAHPHRLPARPRGGHLRRAPRHVLAERAGHPGRRRASSRGTTACRRST